MKCSFFTSIVPKRTSEIIAKIKKTQVSYHISLIDAWRMFPFYIPENTRKPLVFRSI